MVLCLMTTWHGLKMTSQLPAPRHTRQQLKVRAATKLPRVGIRVTAADWWLVNDCFKNSVVPVSPFGSAECSDDSDVKSWFLSAWQPGQQYRQLISIVDFFQQELLLQALIFLNQAHVDDGKMDTLRSWIDELLTHVDQTFLVACSNINN